ncbi:MAG: four helix bundle protein [Paludibacteraceae bacterium]
MNLVILPLKIENIVLDKSRLFAFRIIRMYKHITIANKYQSCESILANQVLRSGTSIGANIREARRAQSKADFIAKLYISLKEADETAYWLELLHYSEALTDIEFHSINADCEELLKLLTSIIRTTQQNNS